MNPVITSSVLRALGSTCLACWGVQPKFSKSKYTFSETSKLCKNESTSFQLLFLFQALLFTDSPKNSLLAPTLKFIPSWK